MSDDQAKEIEALRREVERLRAELERRRPARRFPIQKGPSILWSAMAPHEPQMLRNHGGQTLERIAERHGLDPVEALAVYEDREYPWSATLEELDAHRARWRQVVAKHDAEESENVKLRAHAIPEDAEERIAQAIFNAVPRVVGSWATMVRLSESGDPPCADGVAEFRRTARAILAALRRKP